MFSGIEMLTSVFDCDMMIMLGRSEGECPFCVFGRSLHGRGAIKKKLHRSSDPTHHIPNPTAVPPVCQRRSPQEMTLGDSVNIVKGHFHSFLVSNIFVYLAFCWIRHWHS